MAFTGVSSGVCRQRGGGRWGALAPGRGRLPVGHWRGGRSQGPGVGSLAQRRPASPSRAWRRKVGSGQRQASRTLSHVPRAPCASHAVTEQRTLPPAALAVLGKPVPCSHRCHHRALPLRTGTWLAGGTRRAGPGSRAGCWAVALLATAAATPVSGALIGTPGPWHGSSAGPRAPALCSLSAGVHLQIFLLFVLCLFFFFPLPGDSLSQLWVCPGELRAWVRSERFPGHQFGPKAESDFLAVRDKAERGPGRRWPEGEDRTPAASAAPPTAQEGPRDECVCCPPGRAREAGCRPRCDGAQRRAAPSRLSCPCAPLNPGRAGPSGLAPQR